MDQLAEIQLHLDDRLGLRGVGHGLREHLPDLREMAQQQPLRALQPVAPHVVGKRVVALVHLARDRLRPHVLVADPRMRRRKRVERLVQKFAQRLRVLHLLQLRHPLLVRDALGAHRLDLLALQPVHLPPQQRIRVLHDRLAQRKHVERIVRRLAVELRQCVEQVQRERLVQRKILLQLHVHAQLPARRLRRDPLHDLAVEQRAEKLPGLVPQLALARRRLVAVRDDLPHRAAAIGIATEHEQQHAVRNVEARHEVLRRRDHQLVKRLGIPRHKALRRAPFHGSLLVRTRRGLLLGALVLDHKIGRLHDHEAGVVVALAPGAPGHLPEIAHAQDRRLLPVVLEKLGKHHRADRHVDADAQRVSATDQLEQPALRQRLHQQPVLGQQPRVVHADAVPQPALHLAPVRTVELHPLQLRRQRRLFLLRAEVETHPVLRALGGRTLREINQVDRRAFQRQELPHPLQERRLAVLELQRHRTPVAAHRHARRVGQPLQLALEKRRRAERGRHEQEARLGHREQRHLPRVAALRVRIVVKLVHDHRADVAAVAAVQRDVGQNLRRAAQDRRLRIHARVARHHADVFRPEIAAQRQEFFVHQRLDRTRVHGALAGAQRLVVKGRRHQRFPGAGGRVEDHVAPGQQLKNRLLLFAVELQPALRHGRQKTVEHGIGVGIAGQRRQRSGGGRHRPRQGTLPPHETSLASG